MTNEITRENIRKFLDHNAAERVEATLDNQARLLRLIINDNHSTKTTPKASEQPQNKAKAEEVPQVQAEAVPLTRREQEAAYCNAWYQLILRIFAPLMVAALAMTLTVHAGLSFWVTIPILLVGITLSILTVLVWGLFKWQEAQDHE